MSLTLSAFWDSLSVQDRDRIEATLGISLADYQTSSERAVVLIEFYAEAQRQAKLDATKSVIDHLFDRVDKSINMAAELRMALADEAHANIEGLLDQFFDTMRGSLSSRMAVRDGPTYEAIPEEGQSISRLEEDASRLVPGSSSRARLPILQDSYGSPRSMTINRSETFPCPFGASAHVRAITRDDVRYEQCTLAQNVMESRIIDKIGAMQKAGCPKASLIFKDRCIYINGDQVRV